jgi:hypothetical protein
MRRLRRRAVKKTAAQMDERTGGKRARCTGAHPAEQPAETLRAFSAEKAFGPSRRVSGRVRAASSRRLGYRSRTERSTYGSALRRRRARTRRWLIIAPSVILIALVVGGSVLLDRTPTTVSPNTALLGQVAHGSPLLLIEQDGTVPAGVVIHESDGGGVSLAIPGLTILKTSGGFKTLAELHGSNEDSELAAALGEARKTSSFTVASGKWSDLRRAIEAAGGQGVPAGNPASAAENQEIAAGLLTLLRAATPPGSDSSFDGVPLAGEAADFLAALRAMSSSLKSGVWAAAAMNGTLVEGEGYSYVEPDFERAKALLAGSPGQAT